MKKKNEIKTEVRVEDEEFQDILHSELWQVLQGTMEYMQSINSSKAEMRIEHPGYDIKIIIEEKEGS